jgi:integrase
MSAQIAFNSPASIGFSDTERNDILEWFEEIETTGSESRRVTLSAQLAEALEGYMGIDREFLTHAFWLEMRKPR